MHNVLEDMKENINYDLDSEYIEALKDSNVKTIVKSLKMSDDELKKYTTLIKECACEYEHCKNCKNLLDCKNKVEGYCYLPVNVDGNITFTYKPCKYKEALDNKNKFLDNIKYFNTPEYLKDASFDNIYMEDKERFKTIKAIKDFSKDYVAGKNPKGMYLHGNFGCGKTYLISALFNELAKKGYKSSIVFWPEFLRQIFYDDFKEKFESVKKVPLLLIDDIGAEGLTAYSRDEVLCPLLQYRMDNNLPTFFTSNLSIKELEIHLANSKNDVDVIKSRRIICRIEQLTNDIEMISKNLRK